MASSLAVLGSGLSSIVEAPVRFVDGDHSGPSISIMTLFQATYPSIWSSASTLSLSARNRAKSAMEDFIIFVKVLSGETMSLSVNPEDTIGEVIDKIEKRKGIPSDQIHLMSNMKTLNEDVTVASAGLQANCTIFLLLRLNGGHSSQANIEFKAYNIDASELDPGYDYDFTKKTDDGKKYVRGGYEYHRPYGWYRHAVKVVGEYGDDSWLGTDGIRTDSEHEEWPVSYHGTGMPSAQKIIKEGYIAGPRGRFGKGIYSSPSHEMVARLYAGKFKHTDGSEHQLIFQNRVNPATGHLEVIDKSRTGEGADYWFSPKHDINSRQYDVRPYGILVRSCQPSGWLGSLYFFSAACYVASASSLPCS